MGMSAAMMGVFSAKARLPVHNNTDSIPIKIGLPGLPDCGFQVDHQVDIGKLFLQSILDTVSKIMGIIHRGLCGDH